MKDEKNQFNLYKNKDLVSLKKELDQYRDEELSELKLEFSLLNKNNMGTVQNEKVTISSKDGDIGMQFEASVLLHYHDVDGSQIVVLKTDRRESVEQFLHDELVAK